MHLQVLFDAPDYLVLEKPAGLLSQKNDSDADSLVQEVQRILSASFVGLIHRLDRNTSGLMIVAKNPRSAERLTIDLQNDRIVRRYEAIVAGKISQQFSWQHYLEKNSSKNHVTVFRRPSANSKEARLAGRPLKNFSLRTQPVSLIEFELETGRSHQIRCQAAFEKHPIIGDHRYGKKLPEALKQYHRPALHSSYLAFQDPSTRETMEFKSPLALSEFVETEETIS